MKRLAVLACALMLFSTHCSKSSSGGGAAGLETNLNNISAGFTPASLDYESATRVLREGRNPCEGLTLFSCQPVLLRLYLTLAKNFFDGGKAIITGMKTKFDTLEDGSSGTDVALDAMDGESYTFDYNKTSSTKYTALVKTASSPKLYLEVDNSNYLIKLSMEDDGNLQTEITYTDDTHWSMTVLIAGMTCDEDDARAPKNIRVRVTRAGTVWTGNAQIYNGVWRQGFNGGGAPTCSTVEADNLSMNFYTEFVADDLAAKASVFTVPRNITDIDDLSDYPLSNFCTEYLAGLGANCTTGESKTSDYINPFCNPESTNEALWNNSCSAISTTVNDTAMPDRSNFTTPSDFYQSTVTIPTSL